MKKKNKLLALKSVITSIYGRSPENKIMHCNIEKNGTNVTKVPTRVGEVQSSTVYKATKNQPKSLSRRRG